MPLYDLQCPKCNLFQQNVFLTMKQFDRGHKCKCGTRMATVIVRPPNVRNYVKLLYVPGTGGCKIEVHSKGKVRELLRSWGQYDEDMGPLESREHGPATPSPERLKQQRWERYDQLARQHGLDIPAS